MGPLKPLALEGRSFLSWRLDDARRRRPLIVANPPGDLEFRSTIERVILAGVDTPHELEIGLRTIYPAAVVRRRELSDEGFEVWYVYRDGHWIGSGDHA